MSNTFYADETGSADNETLVEIRQAHEFDAWTFECTAGTFDVYISLDGTNYGAAPVAILDGNTATETWTLEGTAGKQYHWSGAAAMLKVLQKGVTATTVRVYAKSVGR